MAKAAAAAAGGAPGQRRGEHLCRLADVPVAGAEVPDIGAQRAEGSKARRLLQEQGRAFP